MKQFILLAVLFSLLSMWTHEFQAMDEGRELYSLRGLPTCSPPGPAAFHVGGDTPDFLSLRQSVAVSVLTPATILPSTSPEATTLRGRLERVRDEQQHVLAGLNEMLRQEQEGDGAAGADERSGDDRTITCKDMMKKACCCIGATIWRRRTSLALGALAGVGTYYLVSSGELLRDTCSQMYDACQEVRDFLAGVDLDALLQLAADINAQCTNASASFEQCLALGDNVTASLRACQELQGQPDFPPAPSY